MDEIKTVGMGHSDQHRDWTAVVGAIGIIMDALNGGSVCEVSGAILDRILTEHRTLQECFWSAMLLAQIRYADAYYDARNEDAVRLAGLVKDLARAHNFDMGLRFL
jgi:hypothetical protein